MNEDEYLEETAHFSACPRILIPSCLDLFTLSFLLQTLPGRCSGSECRSSARCESFLFNTSLLSSHFKINHPNPPYTQKVVPYTFSTRRAYRARQSKNKSRRSLRQERIWNAAMQEGVYFFSFNKSRISVSSTSSFVGAGGAAGASSFFFFSPNLAINFINKKIEKAMIRKSKVACKKLP